MPHIRLSNISTEAPKHTDKEKTKDKTAKLIEELDALQNLLYAESKHAILIVIQGMDGSGKDGAIKHVIGKLNPQGVTVKSFKGPTAEELSHDFLWRIHQASPPKGMIQVFNRSHYEDILITRVHKYCDDATAKKRMKAINDYESLLEQHNNTHILKFYLHISKEEQQIRLKERIKNPQKQWKYNEQDFKESKLWNIYMKMYEEAFANCNNPKWDIIPSDQNWYKEYLIASKVYDTLKNLDMKFPGLKPKTI